MSKQQKTKQGMASIYVVLFVTMLIGVITLSFLKIMLSETGRTEKTTLADSALNSAMAGVEDAKTLWIKYQQCKIDMSSYPDCSEVVKKVEESDADNCDLGTGTSTEQSIGVEGDNGDITDQAYTCVNLSIEGDFVGSIDNSEPVLVVPMRVKTTEHSIGDIKGVNISWSTEDYSGGELSNITGTDKYSNVVNNTPKDGILGKKGVNSDDEYLKQNGLKVTLIQSGADYDIDSFYAADGNKTNRGTVMLLPSMDGAQDIDDYAFVQSSDKTYNAPVAAYCNPEGTRCSTNLYFPDPVDGDRIEDTFFLTISRLYSEPNVNNVTVKMFDSHGYVNFFNVQPIVDSTGRAGNLLRRVEVRLGANAGALVPLSELTVDGTLDKQLFVTKNCVSGTTSCYK